MNFTYENQGTNTYLVHTVSADENIDSMTLGMLTNNKVPGLATTFFTQMDATKYIKYNVSARIPVSQFFAGAVNKKRLLGVFKGIVSAILSAEDYMIDESAILLDMDYIFADVTTCDTILICLPIEQEANHHDLGAFFKGIMFSTQFDQTENCDHVAKIINYLNSSPLFSLNDFNELLEKIEKNETAATVAAPVAQAVQPTVPRMQSQDKPEVKPSVQTPAQEKPPVAPIQKHENLQFGLNYSPTDADKSANIGKSTAATLPPVRTSGKTGKSKGISLFGFLSSKEKKEMKDRPPKKPAKQPAKPPVKPTPHAGFEVPGAAGVPAAKVTFEVPGQPAVSQAPAKPISQPQAIKTEAALVEEAKHVSKVRPIPMSNKPLNFGETTVLGAGGVGETTVLGGAAEAVKTDPHLIRMKNNEKIPLNKPVFRIGKERSYVDYFVADNTAVSRSHANIVNHNGEFFVVDTNSTNHTYVNGGMIQSNTEVKLSHGTKLRLANEEFEFRLY